MKRVTANTGNIVSDYSRGMSCREVAERHGVSVATVHRVITSAGLPPHQAGRPRKSAQPQIGVWPR